MSTTASVNARVRAVTVIATMLAFAALCLGSASAGAQPAPVPAVTETPPPAPRSLSITFSPFHLALPVVELTGEYRALEKLGIAVILGGGKVTPDNAPPGQSSVPVWEAGAQLRYYVLGTFRHGMQLGAEAIYLHASADSPNVSVTANGFSLGAFAGYKWIADIGFTFDAQLGYQVVGVGADARSGQSMATASESDGSVLLNLNVGWSF